MKKHFLTFFGVFYLGLITLQAQWSANFTYSSNISRDSLVFTGPYVTDGTYFWDFGDGSKDTVIMMEWAGHKYSAPGMYNVCLTIEDYMAVKKSSCQTVTVQSVADYAGALIKPGDLNVNNVVINTPNDSTVVITNYLPVKGDTLQYFWDFGDGYTSKKHSPAHIYRNIIDVQRKFTITLTIKDTINKQIFSYSTPVTLGVSACSVRFNYLITNDSVQFFGVQTGGLSDIYWFFGDGTTEWNTLTPKHKYNPGLYTVAMIGVDDVVNPTCFDYTYQTIQLGAVKCNATFDYFIDSATNTVSFRSTTLGYPSGRYWIFGDGTVSTQANPVHQFSKPGSYTVMYTVRDTGCMDFSKQAITIGAISNDIAPDFIYHADNSGSHYVAFHNRTIGNVDRFIWSFGDGDTSSQKNPTHSYFKDGYYRACLTAFHDTIRCTKCKSVYSVGNSYSRKCNAGFVYTMDSGTITRVSFFNKSSSYGTMSYEWDFGNGQVSNLQNPSGIVFTNPGYYKVSLKITDNYTCRSTAYAMIKVRMNTAGLKTAIGRNVGDSTRAKAQGYPVDFVSISHGDAAKLKWSFGDGSFDTLTENPTHMYYPASYIPERDTFTVCLEVWDQITNLYDKTCEVVNVKSPAAAVDEPLVSLNDELNIYPNPFSNFTTVEYTLAEPGMVTVSLLKPDGTVVRELLHQYKPAGTGRLMIESSEITSGPYLVEFSANDIRKVRKVLIIK